MSIQLDVGEFDVAQAMANSDLDAATVLVCMSREMDDAGAARVADRIAEVAGTSLACAEHMHRMKDIFTRALASVPRPNA